MTGFELLDHTSEIGFEATGETLDVAFEQAGRALFELMTDTADLATDETVDIQVESENLEALFFDFIDQLIYLSQAEQLLLKAFSLDVTETAEGYALTGTGKGQEITADRRLQEVKAPTYSDMEVAKNEEKWQLRMFVDI